MLIKTITYCTIIILIIAYYEANMSVDTKIHYPLKGTYNNNPEYPFRIDTTLEARKSNQESLVEFQAKQGTFIVINPNDDTRKAFTVKPGDDVRISCSAGWCRSQTAYFIFEMFEGIKNSKPHGTRDYFDPVIGPQWDKNVKKENSKDEFSDWIGFEKAERIGHREFSHINRESTDVPQETLDEITHFYDKNYFGPETVDEKTQRVVYITFAANAHAILYRLNQTNTDLSKIIVVCIDMDDYITDPIKEWNTYPRSIVGYTNYAKLLMTFFDFSQLERKPTEKIPPALQKLIL